MQPVDVVLADSRQVGQDKADRRYNLRLPFYLREACVAVKEVWLRPQSR